MSRLELCSRSVTEINDELSAPESSARTWRGMGSSGEDGSKLELGKIVEVSGKGLGIVATRDAVAGEVVAREQGPMAISLSRDQLGVRCCRCAGRAARPSATQICDEGCGTMWCSPECAVADTHLHADSGECSFLLDIGPDPRVAMCQPCGPGDRRTGRKRRVESDWVTLADDVRLLLRARCVGILEGDAEERLASLDANAPAPDDDDDESHLAAAAEGSDATLRRIASIAADAHKRRDGGGGDGIIPEDAEANDANEARDDDAELDSWTRAAFIVFANSFDVEAWGARRGSEFPRPARVAGAVYRTLSRFNHSCAPNCTWSFVHESESKPGGGAVSVNVRAIKPVKSGDELTISYVDPTVGRAERREQLWAKYRFECACHLCAGPRDANGQLPGTDPYLEAVFGTIDEKDARATVEETDGMIRDVRAAIRSIRTDEDVKKLDLAVDALRGKLRCRTRPFEQNITAKHIEGEEARPRWTYSRRPDHVAKAEHEKLQGDGFHPFHFTSMEAYGILGVASSIKAKWLMFREPGDKAGIAKLMKIALGYSMLRASALDELARKEAGFGDAASRAWMEVSERAMSCGVLERVDDPVRGPYRHLDQTYLMSNAFRKVIECDDGGEDGILHSAVMCLPTAPGSMGGPAWHGTSFSGVDVALEPPSGTFEIASDVAMNLADYHSPGLWKHIVGAFNAHQEEVGAATVPMNEDNIEKEEAKPARMAVGEECADDAKG